MSKEITCIHCAHWNLREAPAMAQHGFGACGQAWLEKRGQQ